MELRLDGKVAIVTGGSRGIGEAIATYFAEAGAKVMITSRKPDALAEAAKKMPGDVSWFAANAGDPEGADACMSETLDRHGAIDILVNNAAANPYFGPMIGIDLGAADKTVQVNQRGVLVWAAAAWKAYMHENGGNVINLASIGGLSVEPGIGYYNVTKAAVIHMTRQLAAELGPRVRVNAIAPGLVKTYFAKALWEPFGDAIASKLPLKRLGEPDDIAKVALFLASEASAWITGQTVVVDGGAMVSESGGLF